MGGVGGFVATVALCAVSWVLVHSAVFKLQRPGLAAASWFADGLWARRVIRLIPVAELAVGLSMLVSANARWGAVGLLAVLFVGRLLVRPANGCNCGAPGLARLAGSAANVYVLALVGLALVAAAFSSGLSPAVAVVVACLAAASGWVSAQPEGVRTAS